MSRATAYLSASALKHNLGVVKALAPQSQVLAMIKGNAYGHGLVEVATILDDADYFGVANLIEAELLRVSGINHPLVLMTGPQSIDEMAKVSRLNMGFVLHQRRQLEWLDVLTRPCKVWLKIDTGMHRLGIHLSDCQAAYQQVSQHPMVDSMVLMSHLGCADQPNNVLVLEQIKQFQQFAHGLPIAHSLANGAAIINYPEAAFDIVRPGVMLYGVNPSNVPLPKGVSLKPVMRMSAPIIDIHDLQPGDWVGYGASWHCHRPSRIATVAIGYGDGYPQNMPQGTPVIVKGKPCSIAGCVAMDMLMIDISDHQEIQLGDEAILWGDALSVTEVAQAANRTPYALLTGINQRVIRKLD